MAVEGDETRLSTIWLAVVSAVSILKPTLPSWLVRTALDTSSPLGAAHGWPKSGVLEQYKKTNEPSGVDCCSVNWKVSVVTADGTADEIWTERLLSSRAWVGPKNTTRLMTTASKTNMILPGFENRPPRMCLIN